MGQICCNDSTNVIEDNPSDTNPLLHNNMPSVAVVPFNEHNAHNRNTNENDYQNLTDNILKHTENQMVSANLTDMIVLGATEIDERSRYYQDKTKFISKNLPYIQILPRAVGNPNVILSKLSLTSADINFIRNVTRSNIDVLNQMLEPDTEELIVTFAAI